VQYLRKAANSFFYPGAPGARAWVREQAAKILAGKHRDVRAGIPPPRRRLRLQPRRTRRRRRVRPLPGNKQDHLDYPAFLNAGWPVASGLIEGAARWLIKDRMEVTDVRWSLDGAEAVLKLRALEGNGDYYDYQLRQQKQRDHYSRYEQPQPPPRNQPTRNVHLQWSRTPYMVAWRRPAQCPSRTQTRIARSQ
jgi:hypothetical protein